MNFLFQIAKSRFSALARPFKLTFVITKECHSRCQNCSIWQIKPRNELSLEEVQLVAKENPFFNWVHFIGGEPTDREDFPQIVAAFKQTSKRLYAVNFPTNGLKPKRIWEQAKEISSLKIPKFGVTVSIDGPPEVNDKLRGIPRDFERAVETLQLIRGLKGVESYVGMTLYSENVHLIDETVAAIKKVIPDFDYSSLHLNLPHVSAHYYGNEESAPEIDENSVDIAKLLRRRGSALNPTQLVDSLYLTHAGEYLKTRRSPIPCAALRSSVYLSEQGEVFPCSIWDQPLGNVRDYDYSIERILRSTQAMSTRERVAKLDCPNCWTPCEAYQSLLAYEKLGRVCRTLWPGGSL